MIFFKENHTKGYHREKISNSIVETATVKSLNEKGKSHPDETCAIIVWSETVKIMGLLNLLSISLLLLFILF